MKACTKILVDDLKGCLGYEGIDKRKLQAMIERAENEYYHEFLTNLATPIYQLVTDASHIGLMAIAENAKQGKYDASIEDSNEWFNKEGVKLL